MLRLFYSLLLLGTLALLWFFVARTYRQWRRSRDLRKAIERPKFEYLDEELGRDWRDRPTTEDSTEVATKKERFKRRKPPDHSTG
jgi:hypothetical protein